MSHQRGPKVRKRARIATAECYKKVKFLKAVAFNEEEEILDHASRSNIEYMIETLNDILDKEDDKLAKEEENVAH